MPDNLNEIKKTIRLKFETKKEDVDEAKKQLQSVYQIFGKGFSDELSKSFKGLTTENAEQFGADFATGMFSQLSKIAKQIKDLFVNAWKEIGNMLGYSRLSNAHTRDLAFTYGFTGSQAYGFDKAKNLMGLQSEEDIMYLTPSQRQRFAELQERYTEKYDKLYDSGFFDKYEEYQYEMEEFKDDLKMTVVEFIINNKDLIKTSLNAIMSLAKTAMSILSWISSPLGGAESANVAKMASTTNNSKTTNVKIDNTFTNVANSDKGWLMNAGAMTYQQVLTAIQRL